MAQGYYTLEEASRIVGVSTEELKQMARRGELRSFQDRGTWRFRSQDIEELARRRGGHSDPDLVLGEASLPKPGDSPVRPPSKSSTKHRDEVFDFPLEHDEEDIGLGVEHLRDAPGGSKRQGPKSKPPSSKTKPPPASSGPKSPASSPRTPRPPAGSDSDVRLVSDSDIMAFQLAPDSDVRPKPPSDKHKDKPAAPPPSPKSDIKRKSGPATPHPADSGARLVPMDSDSDVRIIGQGDDAAVPLGGTAEPSATDSDVRLERHSGTGHKPSEHGTLHTEEINLDEELKRQEAQHPSPKAKLTPRSPTRTPPSGIDIPGPEPRKPAAKPPALTDSSDVELAPAGLSPLEPSSDFDLTPTSGKTKKPPSDEEVGLGDLDAAKLKGPSSGISIDRPVDSGISLEQGGDGSDEIEFNISLDAGATPRPGAKRPVPDSDSEFELTLDADASPMDSSSEFELTLDASPTDSSNEFELTLDADAKVKSDSDSEFELTLDEGGDLAAPSKGNIFETDFDIPPMEESGSDAVVLEETADTDLQSSDFEIVLGSDDITAEDESGSQVVALEDEEEIPRDRSRRKTRAVAAGDDVEIEDVEEEILEEEAPARTVVQEKVLPAAPWGAMPVIFLLPATIVLVLATLMGFELLLTSSSGHKPTLITAIGTATGIIDKEVK